MARKPKRKPQRKGKLGERQSELRNIVREMDKGIVPLTTRVATVIDVTNYLCAQEEFASKNDKVVKELKEVAKTAEQDIMTCLNEYGTAREKVLGTTIRKYKEISNKQQRVVQQSLEGIEALTEAQEVLSKTIEISQKSTENIANIFKEVGVDLETELKKVPLGL